MQELLVTKKILIKKERLLGYAVLCFCIALIPIIMFRIIKITFYNFLIHSGFFVAMIHPIFCLIISIVPAVLGIMFLKKINDKSAYLIISHEGIEDMSRLLPIRLIPWTDITNVKHFFSSKNIIINVRNPEKYINRKNVFTKLFTKSIIIGSDTFNLSHEEIYSTIKIYFKYAINNNIMKEKDELKGQIENEINVSIKDLITKKGNFNKKRNILFSTIILCIFVLPLFINSNIFLLLFIYVIFTLLSLCLFFWMMLEIVDRTYWKGLWFPFIMILALFKGEIFISNILGLLVLSMLIFGGCILVIGKYPISFKRTVSGKQARILGGICILCIPALLGVEFLLSFVFVKILNSNVPSMISLLFEIITCILINNLAYNMGKKYYLEQVSI